MAKILLSYGLNMVLTLSFKLVFLNPKQYSKGYFMPNFTLLCVSYGPLSYKWPKYGPFMAKTWLSYDTTTWFILNLNQCAQRYSMPNFILLGVSCSPLSRNGQNMALLWPKHNRLNWFFLNLNHCAKGCYMPNFTLLGSPFS